MDEKQDEGTKEEVEEKKEEEPVKDTNDGLSDIDKANEAAERLERANKVKEKLIEREEKLAVQSALGGKSEAGAKPVKESKEEVYNKEAKERYAGTGLDPTPDDTPTEYK